MVPHFTILLFCLAIASVCGNMYEVSIDSFEPDADIDVSYLTMGTLRVTRKKRNSFSLSGDFEANQNWGNENVGTFEVRGKDGSGPVLLSGKHHFCDFYNSDMEMVKAVIAASNMPPQGTCPLPKGKYAIDGFEIHEKDLPVVVMKDKYVVRATVMSPDGKVVVGYKVRLTVS
ncbi:uncharacterized protein LOC119770266 [Culex quinquefasciatus]|uniref:uncharacterized protein LOC119770266 n=1 Tax=Culex quinquefasciatus TaxID=7176 RepID=UPI0018E3B0DB|nr:uncharacterized protein LOC119770266 [Culex quinquefasciatus]